MEAINEKSSPGEKEYVIKRKESMRRRPSKVLESSSSKSSVVVGNRRPSFVQNKILKHQGSSRKSIGGDSVRRKSSFLLNQGGFKPKKKSSIQATRIMDDNKEILVNSNMSAMTKTKKTFYRAQTKHFGGGANLPKSAISKNEKKNFDKIQEREERQEFLWGKVKAAVKISTVLSRLRTETEIARRARIKRHWDLVRQIARAANSIGMISDHRDANDTKNGIKNYSRFSRVLKSHPSARTESDLEFLMKSTKHLAFFRQVRVAAADVNNKTVESNTTPSLTESQHLELCRTMKLRFYELAHEFIFKQDDIGEEFFIVLEGACAVQRTTGVCGVNRTVAKLEAGGSFGEIALSQDNPVRTASVITLEPTALLVIHKDDYCRILRNAHQEAFDRRLQFLSNVSAFQDLSKKDIFNLGICVQMFKVRPGTSIIKENTPLDPLKFFIIIKRGELEVRKRVVLDKGAHLGKISDKPSENHHQQQQELSLCILGPSETISDYEMLRGKEDSRYQYPYSVIAHTICEMYCISKHDMFGKLSQSSLNLISNRISHFPDARTARNAYAVSMGWKMYKEELVNEILKKKVSTNITKKSMDRPKPIGNLAQNLQCRKTGIGPQNGTQQQMIKQAAHRPSGRKTRKSCFERKSKISLPQDEENEEEEEEKDDDDEEEEHIPKRVYTRISDMSKKQIEEIKVVKTERFLDLSDSKLTMQQVKRNREKSRQEQRLQYQKAAEEMQEFLKDGLDLSRHMYDNALSEGARYFCKSVIYL